MRRYTQEFLARLDGFDFATLENDTSCIYGLARDLSLSYLNRAWYRFARANGAEAGIRRHYPIGTPLAQGLREPERSYYTALYQALLDSGQVWQHDYECSSGSRYRLYHQTAYPLRNQSGILVVNSLRIEHALAPGPAVQSAYRAENGLITACAHCKRAQRGAQPGVWDSVAAWRTAAPANTSHSLCAICYDYFYKHRFGPARPFG